MKNIMQYGFTSLLIIMIAICLYLATGWNSTSALFPRVVGFPMLVIMIVILVQDLRQDKKLNKEIRSKLAAKFQSKNIGMIRYFAWLVGFVILVWAIGIEYTVPIYIFTYMKIEGKYGWLKCGIYAIATAATITILFEVIFRVAWPEGALLRLLNL